MSDDLINRLHDEADLCANEGSDDIARLLWETAAELKRLQTDAARLAWLETHPREATIRLGTDMKPAVFWGVSAAPGVSLRAAIDAAMAEGK